MFANLKLFAWEEKTWFCSRSTLALALANGTYGRRHS
jgi:hypothetical protein